MCRDREGYTQDLADDDARARRWHTVWRKTHHGMPKGAPPYVVAACLAAFEPDRSPPGGGRFHPDIVPQREARIAKRKAGQDPNWPHHPKKRRPAG